MSAMLRATRNSPVTAPRTGVGGAARAALYLGTLWLVLTVNFLLPRAMPGDPLDALQDPASGSFLSDTATRGRVLAYYGLERPLWEQYVRYLGSLAVGDLGWSIRLNTPVRDLIGIRLPWTLLLVVPSLVVATLVSALAGVEAGWARGSTLDRTLVVTFTLVRAVPVFVLGVFAIALFSVQLGWLPLAGATTPFRRYEGVLDQAIDVFQHWLLPAAVLTLETMTARFLLLRNSMIGVVNEGYIVVARAKGLSERALKYRHALRNALLPSITALGAQVGFAVSGAVFIETLFAYPGMGRLLAEAVSARDYPVLQGGFLVAAVAVLLANASVDLLYGLLDPRTREP